MRVMVAGSEGSLMQWVIKHLLSDGHEVLGVDNFSRYGPVDSQRDYEFRQGDLCDAEFAAEVCSEADVIFQAAAQVYGVRGFHERSASILSKDTLLNINLLQAACELPIHRFVYISSSMVYERSQTIPSSERLVRDMQAPSTDYGLSKLIGERLCQAFGRDHDLPYTIWRPFNIITPYETAEGDTGTSHVFADFIDKILIKRQNPLDILGDGEQVRCFTWVDDVASAIARHSFEPNTVGRAINLGNPEPVTMKELARRIFKKGQEIGVIAPQEELEFNSLDIYDDDVRLRVPDITLASTLLGWSPSIELDGALDICVSHAVQQNSHGE